MRTILACLALAGLLAGCGSDRSKPQGSVLHGNVDDRELQLAFVIPERLAAVYPEEGTAVQKGMLVAELETTRISNDVIVAESAVAVRKAQLETCEALLEKALHGSRREDIAMASAGADALNAKAKAASLSATRNRRMVAKGAVPEQTADDAEAQFSFYTGAHAAVTNYLAKLLAGERPEDISAARARVAEARAALAQAVAQLVVARQRLTDCRLYAPAAGIVRRRLLEPGELTSAQRPVLTLACTDPKWVRCYLEEPQLAQYKLNAPAKVHADGLEKDFEGWIGYISPSAEFTPKNIETDQLRPTLVYEVRIYVKDPEGLLKLGAPVTVRL